MGRNRLSGRKKEKGEEKKSYLTSAGFQMVRCGVQKGIDVYEAKSGRERAREQDTAISALYEESGSRKLVHLARALASIYPPPTEIGISYVRARVGSGTK